MKSLGGLIFGFMAPVFFKTGSPMRFEYLNIFIPALTFLLIAFYAKHLSIRIVLPYNIIKLTGLLFNFKLTFGDITAFFELKENILT